MFVGVTGHGADIADAETQTQTQLCGAIMAC